MKIRRSIATALAAGTILLSFGLASPAAHAVAPGPDVIKINPCVLNPDSCTPPTPKGPGDLTIDPCVVTQSCPTPTVPEPKDPDTTDPTPHDDDSTPAVPATAVKAAAAFTG